MEFRKSVMVFSLIAFSVLMLSGFTAQGHAQEFYHKQGMSVHMTADQGSSTIMLSGITSKVTPVTVTVIEPQFGNVISIDQMVPNLDGEFGTQINVGLPLWKTSGVYTVITQHGENTLFTIALPVEVINGVTSATDESEDFLQNIAFSGVELDETTGVDIDVDAPLGGTIITVFGTTQRTNSDVTVVVTEPVFGNVIHTDQVSPNVDGSFSLVINVGGDQWKQDGFYTITAQQGISHLFRDSVEVEIANGAVIPEFGAIAALILAVAIISIIAVSARSRLSLVPKY